MAKNRRLKIRIKGFYAGLLVANYRYVYCISINLFPRGKRDRVSGDIVI